MVQVHHDEEVANRIDPEFMRSCLRGLRRSVDRGLHRPAIEPRKFPHPGTDVVPLTEGNTDRRDIASAETWRRGRLQRHGEH